MNNRCEVYVIFRRIEMCLQIHFYEIVYDYWQKCNEFVCDTMAPLSLVFQIINANVYTKYVIQEHSQQIWYCSSKFAFNFSLLTLGTSLSWGHNHDHKVTQLITYFQKGRDLKISTLGSCKYVIANDSKRCHSLSVIDFIQNQHQ